MFLCNNFAMYSISDVIYTDNSENRKNTKKRNSKPVPKCLILESVYSPAGTRVKETLPLA